MDEDNDSETKTQASTSPFPRDRRCRPIVSVIVFVLERQAATVIVKQLRDKGSKRNNILVPNVD
jgi:hypothetical protein